MKRIRLSLLGASNKILSRAACAPQFAQGEVGVYQVPAGKRNGGIAAIPLNWRDLYVK